MADKVTVVQTSAGTIQLIDAGGGWVYLHTDHPDMGEILLDMSGDKDPAISGIIDGSPRIVIHQPDDGDALLFIRFHPDRLLLNPETFVNVEQQPDTIVVRTSWAQS